MIERDFLFFFFGFVVFFFFFFFFFVILVPCPWGHRSVSLSVHPAY